MTCVEYGKPLVMREQQSDLLLKGQVRIRTHFAGINYAGIPI